MPTPPKDRSPAPNKAYKLEARASESRPSGSPDERDAASRYVVGIDLGTTNSAVASVDTEEQPWQVRVFATPQLVAPGQVEPRESLPSFHYEPASGELPGGMLRLPWHGSDPGHAVGVFAREHGALVPGRMIASAKSWLCHSGVDRTAELLPWHAAPDVTRLSPVEVSARYLRHVHQAWNAAHPAAPLAEQDLVLTLPASFDEVARELTVEAAAKAGLPRVVLIEEPQAAFYAWLYRHAADWESQVEPGQKILVCDIGGGTSDFTLIRVRRGEGGKVQFHRVAVGEHLILGGDNLDLALAHFVEQKLVGDGKLEPRQWDVLVASCRRIKETLLGDDAPDSVTVHLPGSGARLIGGGLQVELAREEIQQVLVEGFFPRVALDERPATRRSGFQEFGLPYAPDAAITRYLAAFLTAHRHAGEEEQAEPPAHDPARPDIVLFNGGVFASPALQRRLVDVLSDWFGERGQAWRPCVLEGDRLDLAVARGAAYYGMVRRGEGVRIAAGLARTYYLGVEGDEAAAVCLVPASAEPGRDVDLTSRRFDLLVSQPVEFPLYVSSTRLTDRPGELVALDREQMRPLAPIRTVLRTRKKGEAASVSVNLHARLTEIGTLDLWCSDAAGDRSWRMQFDVRSATQTDLSSHTGLAERAGFIDEAIWDQCHALVEATFGPNGKDKPEGLVKRLAEASGMNRAQWPPSLLRRFWEALIDLEPGRRRSHVHEARWLNLLGYSLRPGYGMAVDDWRVAETWRLVQGKLAFGTPDCQTEAQILWRRIGGGLSAGQQRAAAEPVLAPVRALHRRMVGGKSGGDVALRPQESAEAWRLLGSLELLDVATKIQLGNLIADLLEKKKMQPVRQAMTWALGRLGARVPLYGPLNTVVPLEAANAWLKRLLKLREASAMEQLAVMQMARRTEDRHRDLPPGLQREVADWLEAQAAPEHYRVLVSEGGTLDDEEQGSVFGEQLPKGLRIAS